MSLLIRKCPKCNIHFKTVIVGNVNCPACMDKFKDVTAKIKESK